MFCPHLDPHLRQEAKYGAQDPEKDEGVEQQDRLDDTSGGGRIRCPKCSWQPRKSDRWACRCGCVWNTFDTRGRCPDCDMQWHHTMCLRCHEWSRHEDWYTSRPSEPGA